MPKIKELVSEDTLSLQDQENSTLASFGQGEMIFDQLSATEIKFLLLKPAVRRLDLKERQ